MDGSYNQTAGKLAGVLALAERSGHGLTHQVFESLVRTVWEMTKNNHDAEALQAELQDNLGSLGGLQFSVKTSRLLSGALDVTGQFCYSGAKVTHTVHLW